MPKCWRSARPPQASAPSGWSTATFTSRWSPARCAPPPWPSRASEVALIPSESAALWSAVIGPVTIVLLYILWLLLPVQHLMDAFSQWAERWGALAVAAFGIVAFAGPLLMIPGAPLSIAAGVA